MVLYLLLFFTTYSAFNSLLSVCHFRSKIAPRTWRPLNWIYYGPYLKITTSFYTKKTLFIAPTHTIVLIVLFCSGEILEYGKNYMRVVFRKCSWDIFEMLSRGYLSMNVYGIWSVDYTVFNDGLRKVKGKNNRRMQVMGLFVFLMLSMFGIMLIVQFRFSLRN